MNQVSPFKYISYNSVLIEYLAPKKQWSVSEWISNFLQDDHIYYGDADYDDNYLPENDPMPGGDADGLYDDIIDDGILESLAIVGLAAALVFLIYYRQQRQNANRRGEEGGAQGGHEGQQQPQGDQGNLFPQPGDPALAQWLAGGVGH
jgi:SEL1 protein